MDTITVYVRKGAHDQERLLSFRRPEDIPTKDLMGAGLAIDGNQAVFSVESKYDDTSQEWTFFHPFQEGRYEAGTLPDGLLDAETALTAWLEGKGYGVEFD